MSRPGHIAMMVGLAWFAAGIVLTGLSFGIMSGKYSFFAIGIILVGIIPFAIGFGQFIAYQLKSTENKDHYHAEIELRALVRAMVAIASADGILEVSEINSISHIYQDLVGHPLKTGMVAKVSKTMAGENYSIHDDLGLTQAEISQSMKENIICACYLVMVADGEISEVEKQRINEIASTLHVPAHRAIELIEDLRKQQTRPKSPKASKAKSNS